MQNMLIRFIVFFFFFGASYLIEIFGWSDHGVAFVKLSTGFIGFMLFLCFVLFAIAVVVSAARNDYTHLFEFEKPVEFMNLIFATLIIYFVSLMAESLFNVEFTNVYQIMFFGWCLLGFKKKIIKTKIEST